jgi:amino acid adenylation domain-containing protein/non-ribosomal peptide synthase protein (TIGR01720 family)
VLQFAAHTFDASLVEILTPLMVGACVCIPSEHERLNNVAGAIKRLDVNHAVLTPSFVGFLLPAAVPGLRRLVLAGEAMTPSHVATWSHIELVNGYGPAESSVAAVVNPHVGPGTEPTDIGMPCGVRVWLVNPANHHCLVPVGCVGEMLLEGPSLARGYLNDRAKTEESFIFDPAWVRVTKVGDGGVRRFYKTGDLARYNSASGSLSYVGRKDTQIKFHGQRIELGEIEHHLAVDENVQHALVLLPKVGPLASRLIAVLSLSESSGLLTSGDSALTLIEDPSLTEPILQGIRERLGARLPAYMVPSTWLCVNSIPMLASRKMDRKTVSTWVESVISVEQCQRTIMGHRPVESMATASTTSTANAVEAKLLDIWSMVLNLPADQINLDNRSFLSLSGDSISAMACVSQAKKAALSLTVQEVLRAKSLRQLAAAAKPMAPQNPDHDGVEEEEPLDVPFDLSPIQQLHFQVRGEAQADEHFNQSFCLRLLRHVDEAAVRGALKVVVRRHGMLRTRFRSSGESGQWQQFITDDVPGSYRFRAHVVNSASETEAGISSAQGCLDVRIGPVFAAELFAVKNDGHHILFMTAHHLIIDLVSWRVILEEMEEVLDNKPLAVHPSLSFRRWTALQIESCAGKRVTELLPAAAQVPAVQFAYWGMHDQLNLYGDVVCQGFELDTETTATLTSKCHTPFRTETVDLLLAALIWSFHATFRDRAPPAIFNEGHGREPPPGRDDIDISRTIGWFTTLFPVALASPTSFVDALIQTKDLRRRVPGNGRPYFAARVHTDTARWGLHHKDMEVAFNFLGRYQQLERAGALFQPAAGALMAGEAHQGSPTADFGRAARRFALFEVSAVIVQGALRFSFAWNGGMRHQSRIREWIGACSKLLEEAAATLPRLGGKMTPSDLVLFPELTQTDLDVLESTKLPLLAGDQGWDAVEDIYPNSPIQQGLLMSRSKDGSFYAVRRAFRVKGAREVDGAVDVQRLVQSWKRVVQHHALLRTVFVDAISQTRAGSFDQVVLKDIEPLILKRKCPCPPDGEDAIRRMMESLEPIKYQNDKPQHRLSVFYDDSDQTNDAFCVLEMSHAIMDGASMDILLRDLGRSYDGSLGRLPRPLFSPFVASLQQRDAEADVAFWTRHLDGIEPCHFPILNDGVHVSDTDRQLRSLRISLPGLAALRMFCDTVGVTLPNAFHAAWALTLACYTGTDDVCFGYLVSGRDAALVEGSEEAVGPFINMATQRVRFGDQDLSLLRVLETVQKDQLDCMPYAQASLAEVQHALNLPGGMALFNTCVSYRRRLSVQQSPQQKETDAGPLVFEDVGAIHDPTEYPISLNIEMDDEGGAAIDVDYWTDAIASPQAQHVANTFVQALLNITEHADMAISLLDVVHEQTKEHIWNWNANLPPVTAECVHRMVEKQAALRPLAQAIQAWDGDFSYREMNVAANRLAQHLLDFGVGPEILVPVCFDKSAWTTIAMLAVLKAGGGVVPLNAADPAHALESKVADANTHIVVASTTRASLFEPMVPYVVAVGPELLSRLPSPSDGQEMESDVSPTDPAFVMFTSGSTGQPKGVVLCHQALVSSALAHGSSLGLSPDTRFLQFASHTFDNSLEEMLTTLMHGGCVCVPSEADRLGNLAGAIDTLDANFMDLTPTVAALLQPQDVPKIRGIAVGGEALTQEVLDIWADAIPVHNQYGPSECSINATHRLHTHARGDVANIGTSVGSVSWVVDPGDHNRLMPVGCVGELLIEGPILARGYLNRPTETAKAFVSMPRWAALDPRCPERGNRTMYKTGDLVRYDSDGSMIYMGRKDTQVKLHGQRIELGEIEHHVKAHLLPAAQSSVELLSLGPSQKVLAVFICLSSSADMEANEVRILPVDPSFASLAQTVASAMAEKLVSYMVPGLFLPVSRMPLTSSGKLDRRFLRTMAQTLAGADGKGVMNYRLGATVRNGRAPETPMEKKLQELWSTVLNVDVNSISADDSFFRHGGDSVMAMRLVAAARQKGIMLTVATIFQTLKLSQMAKVAGGHDLDDGEVITDKRNETLPGLTVPFSLLNQATNLQSLLEHVASICRVHLDSVEDMYPCTPLQAGLVAASQMHPGAYVAMNSYALPAGTDMARFKKAWQDVVDSEAILRTRVVFVEEMGFLQVVVRDTITWSTAPSLEDLPETHRQLPPHDGGILSRYTIIGESNSQPIFTWTAHHALYDGWSLPTLLARVEERFRHPEVPPVLTPHYSRFVEYLASLDVATSDAYWAANMSSISPSSGSDNSAPQQFPQLPHPGYRVRAESQTSRTTRFMRPRGAELTTASSLRAAWALVVSIYSSSDDVVFGEVLSGRDVPLAGVEDLVGPTLTTLPRRIRIDRSMSVERMLADVQTQLNDAIPHQFTGLQRIKTLSPDAAAACEFQNLLVIDAAEEMAEDSLWSTLTSGGNRQGADFFSYPLNMTCTVGRNKDNTNAVEMRAYFDAHVLPPRQVDRMLGLFETLLQRLSAVESQRESIGDMDLLSEDDKAMVREWNKNPVPLVERRIHDIISEQMACQGSSATAVVGWDAATLSHGELDALSTAMARELISKGVGSGADGGRFVPFCLEKSVFAVVAMLAILKAGAAFVPLDPVHPVTRLREIVADCSATVVICSPRYHALCSQIVGTVVPGDMALLRKMAAKSTLKVEGTSSFLVHPRCSLGKHSG